MFDRDDNIYSGGPGLISGTFQLGLGGLAVAGGLKLINNSDSMKKAALKMYDKVAPITDPTLNAYDQSVKNIRSSVLSNSKARVLRSGLGAELKTISTLQEHAAANGVPTLMPEISNIPFNDLSIPEHTKPGWGIKKWSDITDFAGKDVGTQAYKNLAKMNSELGLGLDLANTTWSGTTAIIPTTSGANVKIGFSMQTSTGEHIVKNGNATYSANTFYERVMNDAGELTGELNIIDQNSRIAELLGNQSMVKTLAANSVSDSAILSHLTDSGLGGLERILNNRAVAKESSEALERQGYVQRLKAAMKFYGTDDQRYTAPLDEIGRIRNAGLIVPDPYQQIMLRRQPGLENFGSEHLEANAIKPIIGTSTRDTSAKIAESYRIYKTKPTEIKYKGVPIQQAAKESGSTYLNDMVTDLFYGGGINQNVSSGQIPYRTANIGGLYTGPSVAEGYKTLSTYSFSTHGRVVDDKMNWRYRSRYASPTQGRTGRLVDAINRNRSVYTMHGGIDFLGEERFEINSRFKGNMYHESPITASFEGYSESQGKQAISIKRIGSVKDATKEDLLMSGEWEAYTLADLYNNSTDAGREVQDLLMSGEWEAVLPKGMEIGNRDLARPISGYLDELGTDTFNRSVRLKQMSLIGKNEYAAFAGINANKEAGELIQLPLRMRTLTTKIGGHGGLWRASNTYRDMDGGLEFVAGVDLFKNIIPTLNKSGNLVAAKQANEILPFIHSLMLGDVETLNKAGRTVKLTGDRAKQFNSFLGIDQLSPTTREIDLTHLMRSGDLSFNMSHDDPEAYAKQLGFMTDLASDVRYSMLNGKGQVELGAERVAGEDYLTKSWNSTVDFFKNDYETTKASGKLIPKEHLWTLSTQLTALEGLELSQGAKGFNTAKFSMRDQYMYIASGREGVLNELLSRNEVDSVQLTKERELLLKSIMDPENMGQAVQEYSNYVREIHGDAAADSYLKQANLYKANDITGMKEDLQSLGAEARLSDAREIKEYISKSFIANDSNSVGKVLVGDDGRLIHLPSSQAMRGMTVLPNGKITFEGKEGTNVKAFWNIAHEATLNGTVPRNVLQKTNDAYHNLYSIIGKDSASIQIHSASYARNVYDDKLTNSKIMEHIEAGMVGGVEVASETRATIGSMASISRRDAALMIQDEIMKAIHLSTKTGGTVVKSMNDIHSDWIAKDHGDILENIQNVISDAGSVDNLNEIIGKEARRASNQIVRRRIKGSKEIATKLRELDSARVSGNTSDIKTLLDEVAGLTKEHGIPLWAGRDPIIFHGSESGAYGLININKHSSDKQISLGFMHKVNMAGDTDGDKIKYLMMHSKEARENIHRSVIGVQAKAELFMREGKGRLKLLAGSGGTQKLNFSEIERRGLSKFIYETQGEASVYAHFMTKAYTGSMNTEAFLTKAGLERTAKLAQGGHISADELETVLAWTRSIPSLMTEQQVISSKHISAIIEEGLKAKTPIHHIMENIGKVTPEDMLSMIKETGSVHPLLQKSLAVIKNSPARKQQYAEVIDVADTITNMSTGFGRITEEDLRNKSEYIRGERSDSELETYINEMIERQKKFAPINEREEFKKILGIGENSTFLDFLSKAEKEHKGNPTLVLQNVQEHLKKAGLAFSTAEHEHVMNLINDHIGKVWKASDELYGSEALSRLPKASRQLRGWNKIAPKIQSASNWIKEAPLQRLGGIGAVALGTMAMFNILNGSSINSERDVPSMNNPGMEGYGNYSIGTGQVNGNNFRNTSYSLLSRGTTSHAETISSVNNMVGNNGYHSVSVRSDSTNPYLDKMSYYN